MPAPAAKLRSPLQGGRKARPTKRHSPLVWECMLGTVYARSADGTVKYFDYDWVAARRFAGVADDLPLDEQAYDLRVCSVRASRRETGVRGSERPYPRQYVLWGVHP